MAELQGAAGAILREQKVHRGRVFLGGDEENNGAIFVSSCVSQTVDNHFSQPQMNSQSLSFSVKTLKYHLKKTPAPLRLTRGDSTRSAAAAFPRQQPYSQDMMDEPISATNSHNQPIRA